jgi:hypothetical protein
MNNVSINASGGMVWLIQAADTASTGRCEHRAEFTFATTGGEVIKATHRMYISPTLRLASYEDVQTLLGELSESDELLLEQLSDALTDRIERYTGRKLAAVLGTTQYFSPGDKRQNLTPQHWPLKSVTSLHEDLDGEFTSDTLIDPEDYYVDKDNGRISLRGGMSFLGGPGSVKVVYTAGYDDIGEVPMDLRMAASQQVAYAYQRRASAGIASESVNGMSVTRYVEDLLPALKVALDHFQPRVVL